MPTSQALSNDDPRMIAWNKYKETEEYSNTKGWAGYAQLLKVRSGPRSLSDGRWRGTIQPGPRTLPPPKSAKRGKKGATKFATCWSMQARLWIAAAH